MALTVVSIATARAGNIEITLDNPNQSGSPGSTLSFFGTITNTDTNPNDQPIYLNSDSLNFSLADGVVADNFFLNVPVSLAPGEMSGDIDLFDIQLANPRTSPNGVYGGSYTLLGGMDGGSNEAGDVLGGTGFSATMTPEPSTGALIVAGLVCLGMAPAAGPAAVSFPFCMGVRARVFPPASERGRPTGRHVPERGVMPIGDGTHAALGDRV